MRVTLHLLVASSATALGIIVPHLWFAVFIGLSLFFALLRGYVARPWSAALCGLTFGVVTGGAGTIWFWDTLPLSFLGINDPTVQKIAVGMTWGYVAASLGAPVMIAALAIWLLRASRLFPLFASCIWAVTEIGRMWSFALTTWGPQSLFGPHFSAASVGYAITENAALLRLAHPFGVDGLNLYVAAGAACLATVPSIWRRHDSRSTVVATTMCAIAGLTLPILGNSTSPPIGERSLRFAIISEHIEEVRDFSTHHLVATQLAAAAAANPPVDVIVLPEEFSLTSIFWSRSEASNFLEKHFGNREVLILNTRNELYPEDERNEAPESKKLVYDSTIRGELGRYTKQMLMPLGEYAPAFTKTFFSLLNDPELHLFLEDVGHGPEVGRQLNVGEFKNVRLGGLLCSDMLSPRLYRALVREHHAQILVNLSNHFWFHGSKTLYWKTIQMARVHAVQNRAPIVVSNNVAPSFALDSDGALLAQAGWNGREILYVDISVPAR